MKIAICPGSFDPITLGHIDIIERSAKIFDKVYVVVMVNPAKQPTFSTEERIDMIKQTTGHISNVVAESYTGLIADYAKEKGACTLARLLRIIQRCSIMRMSARWGPVHMRIALCSG